MRNKIRWFMALLAMCVLLSCDKLEDGDGTQDILPGRWLFSYATDEPLDFELSYKWVIFNDDGTCSLVYSEGQLDGTYRASRDVIRIVTSAGDGEERTLLWRVLAMSPYRVVTRYEHEFSGDRRVAMTVTLEKLL